MQCALIGIDWGTTHARAYRIGADGTVLAQREAPLGIQRLAGKVFAEALDELLGEWRRDPLPRLACGMVGSRNGWIEAPYVDTPATLAALAASLVHTAGRELAIVPGCMTRDARGVPDVMRGEETQVLGARADGDTDALYVLPGTHSKWATVERGEITAFATFMTGEMHAVLLAHSILARLADSGGELQAAEFARGVAHGLGDGALLHDVFAARTLALTGELARDGVADFLSGLLIGREVRDGLVFARRAGRAAEAVRLVGAQPLCDRYATACAHAGVASTHVDDAAPRGLWRIARAAGMLEA
jgi:2-dehydro-3-deoxygalactonokinase